jgi:ribosomal protein S18 acetylase RimI-like enzyme
MMAMSLLHLGALSWSLGDLAFRRAQPAEASLIFSRLLREKMNPISVRTERFLLAWDKPNGAVAGFGQIRPVGDGACELASLIVEPGYRGLGVGTVLVTKLLAQHRISVSVPPCCPALASSQTQHALPSHNPRSPA